MPLTPEQKAANEALSEAIAQAMQAYGYADDRDMLVNNWVILVEQVGWSSDGVSKHAMCRLYRDGDMPWTIVIGMLRANMILAETSYLSDFE